MLINKTHEYTILYEKNCRAKFNKCFDFSFSIDLSPYLPFLLNYQRKIIVESTNPHLLLCKIDSSWTTSSRLTSWEEDVHDDVIQPQWSKFVRQSYNHLCIQMRCFFGSQDPYRFVEIYNYMVVANPQEFDALSIWQGRIHKKEQNVAFIIYQLMKFCYL